MDAAEATLEGSGEGQSSRRAEQPTVGFTFFFSNYKR